MYDIIKKYKLLSLHLMVLILGFTGILGKLISLNSLPLVWYRMTLAFLILLMVMIFKKTILKINKRNFIPLLGAGMIVGLHWLFFFESIKVANISIAVICLSTSSLFSAFLEPIFFKRKLLKYEVLFGMIVLASLSYMLYEKPTSDMNFTLGYTYGIISAFLATLFTLINGKFINKIDATEITTIEMLGGVIIISIILLINQDISIVNNIPSINDLFYLILLSSICTAAVFVWMIEIMRYITPYAVIMAVNLEPIYSIILALFLFNKTESMNFSFYIGSSIILLIVFLDGYIKNRK